MLRTILAVLACVVRRHFFGVFIRIFIIMLHWLLRNWLPCTLQKAKLSQSACKRHIILRCFQSRDPCVLLRAFKVYVRPILEFNTTVWSPVQKQDIEAIEKIQHRFTKRLYGLRGYSYSERLQKLNLQSLELRGIHYDLTLTYQVVFGLSVLRCQEFFQLSGLSSTRGHRFKLMKQQSHGYRRHLFATRVVNIWNFLPEDVVNFSTLCSFKNSFNAVHQSKIITWPHCKTDVEFARNGYIYANRNIL